MSDDILSSVALYLEGPASTFGTARPDQDAAVDRLLRGSMSLSADSYSIGVFAVQTDTDPIRQVSQRPAIKTNVHPAKRYSPALIYLLSRKQMSDTTGSHPSAGVDDI
jgi:hypothetical protein